MWRRSLWSANWPRLSMTWVPSRATANPRVSGCKPYKTAYRYTYGSFSLGAHAHRGLQYFVCVSVCLFACSCSRTAGYKAAYDRYQRLQNYASLKSKMEIFLKSLRSRDMSWKLANLGDPLAPCTWGQKKSTKGVYRLTHVMSDSPRAISGRPRANAYSQASPSISSTAHA